MNLIIFIIYSFLSFLQLQQHGECNDQRFSDTVILSMATNAHCPLVSSSAARLIQWWRTLYPSVSTIRVVVEECETIPNPSNPVTRVFLGPGQIDQKGGNFFD